MTDPSWIREALERHERALVAYAARITGELEAARDVVQETFVKLCAARREAVEPHLAEWLFTVCRNAALDHARHRGRARNVEAIDMNSSAVTESTLSALERREEGARAIALLARLPKTQAEVLRLRFQGELSYKEIARVTGQSIGNVGWAIHMGLKSLRELLAGDALEGKVL